MGEEPEAAGMLIALAIGILVMLASFLVVIFNQPTPRHHLYYCQPPEGGFEICGDRDVTISVSNLYFAQPRSIG